MRRNDAQRAVVLEQCFVDFGEASEDGGVGRELLAHFDEGADDEGTHLDGACIVEDAAWSAPCSEGVGT